MSRPKVATAGLSVAALAAIVVSLTIGKADEIAKVNLICQKPIANSDLKSITVEFSRLETNRVWFSEPPRMRVRVTDQWLKLSAFPPLDDTYLLQHTNRESFSFTIPARASSCRFQLGYRIGGSPFCRAYFFLENHGIRARAPALSKLILTCVPREARLRRITLELPLPES
jgi:hypothetical protein